MERRFNIKITVPDVVAERYDLNKETLLEAYYEDGFIYVEGVEIDECEEVFVDAVINDCPHRCPCCGHCDLEE